MGAGRMDYKELSQEMDLKTGGMAANIHLADHSSQMGAYEQVAYKFVLLKSPPTMC